MKLKVVFKTVDVNAIAVVSPLQMVSLVGEIDKTGIGFTCTVAEIGVPVQPFNDGVTEYVMLCADVEVFINVWEMVDPVPFEAPVMDEFDETVQAKFALLIELVTNMFAKVLLQISCEIGDNVTDGIGWTTTVAILVSPIQLPVNTVIV